MSNIDTHVTALKATLAKLGAAEGKGDSSRPAAAIALVDAAREGYIDEDDAPEMFASYVNAKAKMAAHNPLVTATGYDSEQKSAKQQVSKFRQFIKLGALPNVDAPDLLDRAAKLVKGLVASGTKCHPMFDAMLNVAREQIKTPNDTLTDEQITAVVSKAEPRTKDELEKLVDLYKRAVTLAGNMPSPSLDAAVSAMADAIVEAGGEVPPTTKEDKELAAFMLQAKKLGLAVTIAQ